MKNISKEARRNARTLFKDAFDGTGRFDNAKALRIADLLIASAPRDMMQILKEYRKLIRLDLKKHHAVIESAVPLESSMEDFILNSLHKKDTGTMTWETKVNPSLIGGVRIQLGSEIWDASLSSRLNALAS